MKWKYLIPILLLLLLCSCVEKADKKSKESCNHVWSEDYREVAPTEEEDGARVYSCVLCGETKETAIPMLEEGDEYFVYREDATCEERGSVLYISEEWGEYTVDLPPLGHNYGDAPKECTATCTEDGENIYVCSFCRGEKRETVRAFGHNYVVCAVHEGTCIDKGYTEYQCTRCLETYTANVTDYGHRFVFKEEIPGSCEEKGYKLYVCEECRTEKKEYTDFIHIYNKDTGMCTLCNAECEHTFSDYVCTECRFSIREELEERSGIYVYGDITYFGCYPQSHVSDESLLESLDEVFSDKKTEHVFRSVKYVSANVTDQSSRSLLDFSDGTQMSAAISGREIHYFRYDPIAWKEGKDGVLVAVSILDGGVFQSEEAFETTVNPYFIDEANGIYANNWAASKIRRFLAETFYEKAFNETQKAMISLSENVNSGGYYSTDIGPWCQQEDTSDRVFLAGFFDLYAEDAVTGVKNEEMEKKATDYALCSGLKIRDYDGHNAQWFLRSAGLYSAQVCAVCDDGSLSSSSQVVEKMGIVPAIRLNSAD